MIYQEWLVNIDVSRVTDKEWYFKSAWWRVTGQEWHVKSEMLGMSSQEKQLIKSDNDISDRTIVNVQAWLFKSNMKHGTVCLRIKW